jgi:hypothetical protein
VIVIGTERERQVAFVLLNVWYSSLGGWAGGLHSPDVVVEHVRIAASLMSVSASPAAARAGARSSSRLP